MAAPTTTGAKPRKWIDAEIARLDPEQDYERIYQLMTGYRSTQFMLDLMYIYTFPHFMVPLRGPLPVWRDGAENNKVVQRGSTRADDTLYHNMLWVHGPSDARAQKSVETINKIHAHYAKDYPDSFGDHEDYLYVWLHSVALTHRLERLMGLPGYTENEKIAAHRFWLETGKLFKVPGDTSGGHPVDGFPADFDGVLEWLEEFENRDWTVNEVGRITVEAVIAQFEFRYVAKPLRPLVRAALVSFFPKSVRQAYRMKVPPRPVQALLRRAVGVLYRLSDLAADPTETYMDIRARLTPEERKAAARERREQDTAFAASFTAEHGHEFGAVSTSRCPVPHGSR